MVKSTLDFPQVFLLDAHIPTEQLLELEDQIPNLTYDISEARVILGKVGTKQRAQFELRKRNLYTLDISHESVKSIKQDEVESTTVLDHVTPRKRRKAGSVPSHTNVIDLESESESESSDLIHKPVADDKNAEDHSAAQVQSRSDNVVNVVKLSWFMDSVQANKVLPLDDYLVFAGRVIHEPTPAAGYVAQSIANPRDILLRAKNDAPPPPKAAPPPEGTYRVHGRIHRFVPQDPQAHTHARPIHLLHQTTSEHDDSSKLPPLPSYLHTVYSCQRPAAPNPPNEKFIELLKKIRHHRKLIFDEIGVRAYSSSIASIAAYPHILISAYEVTRLPGCDDKIAHLFQEWTETGRLKAVDDIEADPKHKILDHFYNIWGCAEKTANEFYNKGYVDIDDVVQHEWKDLNRSQQIGVKFYDEFLVKIPRQEVTDIGNVILAHANALTPGFQMCIVGGYRRGKSESGDVDVVLSHPDETVTQDFIVKIDDALYKSGWITHSLTITSANSERGQMPVAWKGDNVKHGSGFDTLDKALVVWQDPSWPNKEQDLAADPRAKNPNIHRRVDIIISPWKTAGCAVMGWTSGTTFNRDLRRYCRKEKGLKFDSSGIRNDSDGTWVDFENGVDGDLVEKEKAVFKGIGLEWREPDMRCTN